MMRIFFVICLIILIVIIAYKWWTYKPVLSNVEKLKILVPKMYEMRFSGTVKDDEIHQNMLEFQEYWENKDTNETLWGYNWAGSDSSEFDDMLREIEPMIITASKPQSTFYKNQKFWQMVEDFIILVTDKINFGINYKYQFPFGNNWYAFSITLPRIIASSVFYYRQTFNKPNPVLESTMKRYVTKIIETPRLSLGWSRQGSNAVMMFVPFLISHILMGDWVNYETIPDVVETFKDVYLPVVKEDIGLYPDGSFLFHQTKNDITGNTGYLRAYGYLTSSFTEYYFLNEFFESNHWRNAQIAFDKLCHPTIRLHYPSWFTRTVSMSHSEMFKGKLGRHLIDTIRGVSILAPGFVLQFNGQSPNLSFAEVDYNHSKMPLISIFMRRLLYQNTAPSLNVNHVPFYPGVVSNQHTALELRVEIQGQTTHQYFPEIAKSAVVGINGFNNVPGYVGLYNHFSLYGFNMTEMVIANELGMYNCIKFNHEHVDTNMVRSIGYGKTIDVIQPNRYYLIDRRELVCIYSDVTVTVLKLTSLQKLNNTRNTTSDKANNYSFDQLVETSISNPKWKGTFSDNETYWEDDDDKENEEGENEEDDSDQNADDEVFYCLSCPFDEDGKVFYSAHFRPDMSDGLKLEQKRRNTEEANFIMKNGKVMLMNNDVTLTYADDWASLISNRFASFACTTTYTPTSFVQLPINIFRKHIGKSGWNEKNVSVIPPPDPVGHIYSGVPKQLQKYIKDKARTNENYNENLYTGLKTANGFSIRNNFTNSRITLQNNKIVK